MEASGSWVQLGKKLGKSIRAFFEPPPQTLRLDDSRTHTRGSRWDIRDTQAAAAREALEAFRTRISQLIASKSYKNVEASEDYDPAHCE